MMNLKNVSYLSAKMMEYFLCWGLFSVALMLVIQKGRQVQERESFGLMNRATGFSYFFLFMTTKKLQDY